MRTLLTKPAPTQTFHRRQARTKDVPVIEVTTAPLSSAGYTFIQSKLICPCDGGCPRCTPAVQSKLKVGAPGDIYEREADRVAEQVMRMPQPVVQKQPEEEEEMLQTKPVEISPLVQRQTEEEGEEEEETIQPKQASLQTPLVSPSLESHIHSMKGKGQHLPASTRAFFEPRFGYDFFRVKVHADSEASEVAQATNARAFTVGRDIAFGAGQYAPETTEGRNLLAHELTHTIQQSGITRPMIQRQLFPPIPIIVPPAQRNAPVEVNAIDARQASRTAWYKPWRYSGPITSFFRGDVEMIDIASMVRNVIAHLARRRISRLNIIDHGNEQVMEIGSDSLSTAADVAAHAATLGRLRPHFASNGFVHMQNCRAGQNRAVVCALATTFGVPVYAGTGLQNPLLGFNFGDYVRCHPNGTFNPNVGRPSTPMRLPGAFLGAGPAEA